MKKRIAIGLLLIIGLLVINQPKTIIKTDKKEVFDTSTSAVDADVHIFLDINKLGEDDQFLPGVGFVLKSYNNALVFHAEEKSNYYLFSEERDVSFSVMKRVLSAEQLETINSINSTKDFDKLSNGNYFTCTSDDDVITKCNTALPTVLILEEESVPTGYGKTKLLIPAAIELTYMINGAEIEQQSAGRTVLYRTIEIFGEDDYPVQLISMDLATNRDYISMEYGEVYPDELVGLDIDEAYSLWDQYGKQEENLCGVGKTSPNSFLNTLLEPNTHVFKEDGTIRCSDLIIKNQKGKVDLEVTGYVNNSETAIAEINSNLEYRIVVKNNGGVDALDSIVSTKIPEGFIVIDGSISDKGEYKDGTISWNVLNIKAGEEKTLSFKAYPSNTVKEGQTYSGDATVENFAVENGVVSNKMNVKIPLTGNPKTWAPIGLIIGILLLSSLVFNIVIQNQQKQKKEE